MEQISSIQTSSSTSCSITTSTSCWAFFAFRGETRYVFPVAAFDGLPVAAWLVFPVAGWRVLSTAALSRAKIEIFSSFAARADCRSFSFRFASSSFSRFRRSIFSWISEFFFANRSSHVTGGWEIWKINKCYSTKTCEVLLNGPNVKYAKVMQYSGDLNTNHLNTGNIWIPNFLKFGFQKVRYSNGPSSCVLCSRRTIQIPDQCIRKQDGVHLSSIQMVALSCNQMAFENQTI